MRLLVIVTAVLATLLSSVPVDAGENRLAPLPRERARVVHGPYEQGACETCHERADAGNPGPAQVSDPTCLGCHDEFAGQASVRIGKGRSHPSGKGACTACHNPHNSTKGKLLLEGAAEWTR